MDSGFADRLNKRYFDGKLSQTVLDQIRPVEFHGDHARRFISHLLELASKARLPARHFSPLGIMDFADGAASARIPQAMNGLIPPATLPGRHRRIDDFVADRIRGASGAMLDVGCAYPPWTTKESAERFSSWDFVGFDPLVQPLYLYDGDENYAVFDYTGNALCIVPGKDSGLSATSSLFSDIEATQARFHSGLSQFADLIGQPGDRNHGTHERQPWKLVIEPFFEYTGTNLSYAGSRVEASRKSPYTVIRCFNVMMYQDRKTRADLFSWFGEIVDDDTLVIVGRDGIASAEATFTVYRLQARRLKAVEFCFSIDCLRPIGIMPWYCYGDDDPETLAIIAVSRLLREDAAFCRVLDERFDSAWEEWGLYRRDADGHLVPFGDRDTWWPAWWASIKPLVDFIGEPSLVDAAVGSLQSRGVGAWRNSIGYVSVDMDTLMATQPRQLS